MNHAIFFAGTRYALISLTLFLSFAFGASAKPPGHEASANLKSSGHDLADRYKKARSLMDANSFGEAKTELLRILEEPFLLGDYAAFDLAVIETGAGSSQTALKILDRALKNYPYTPLKHKMNELSLRTACDDPVLPVCGVLLSKTRPKNASGEFRSQREFYKARLIEAKGKKAKAYKLYQKIFYHFPTRRAAQKARRAIVRLRMEEPVGSKSIFPHATFSLRMKRVEKLMKKFRYKEAVADLERILEIGYSKKRKANVYMKLGLAKHKARDKYGARLIYQKFLNKYPRHRLTYQAKFRIAVIDWNLNKNRESFTRLNRLIKSKAGRKIKRRSHIILGKIAQADKNFDTALKNYKTALRLGPTLNEKHDLQWRLGWIEYQRGDIAKARAQLSKAESQISFQHQNGKLLYWKARMIKLSGNNKKAEKSFKKLGRLFGHTYYGTRISGMKINQSKTPITFDSNSFYESLEKLDGRIRLGKRARRHRDRYNMLKALGFYDEAKMELDSMFPKAPKRSDELLWLGLRYREARAPHKAIRLFVNSSGRIKHSFDFSEPFWRIIYPVEHWEMALEQSEEHGIDPFLILAVIRAESSFEKKAVSPANARGLMQLMSSVGKKEYKKIGMAEKIKKPYNQDILFDPSVNISLGASYLAGLVSRYEGRKVFAIAAYNAGTRAVDRWKKRYGALPEDELIENISYPETRKYVKRVLRSFALYHLIYSNSDSAPEM